MQLCTTRDAARHLGVSDRTVRRAARQHRIGKRTGAGWIFTPGDLARLKKVIRSSPGNPNWKKQK